MLFAFYLFLSPTWGFLEDKHCPDIFMFCFLAQGTAWSACSMVSELVHVPATDHKAHGPAAQLLGGMCSHGIPGSTLLCESLASYIRRCFCYNLANTVKWFVYLSFLLLDCKQPDSRNKALHLTLVDTYQMHKEWMNDYKQLQEKKNIPLPNWILFRYWQFIEPLTKNNPVSTYLVLPNPHALTIFYLHMITYHLLGFFQIIIVINSIILIKSWRGNERGKKKEKREGRIYWLPTECPSFCVALYINTQTHLIEKSRTPPLC